MIDLQNFVDKKVRVTYKNGEIEEGTLKGDPDFREFLRFYFRGVVYFRNGYTGGTPAEKGFHIVGVESMEFEDNYKQLVAEVSALRAEVESLKAERSAPESGPAATALPDLKPMRVTRSFVIQPEEYFEYCTCYGEEPSKDGYIYFAKLDNDDMFTDEGTYEETVEEIEE